jgi:formylglycine-generating enzyme
MTLHAAHAATTGSSTPDDMVEVPGGRFRMGSDRHYPEEAPTRQVEVGSFRMERTQVTNRQFSSFVDDTGYLTVAERPMDPAQFPGAPQENLAPGSLVFTMTSGPVDLRHLSQWWTWTPGASWRHPFGPTSSTSGLEEHPVVHIALEDADAYARWAGRELPSEAEWERAARGGLEGTVYVWGDEPERPDERLANYWHGDFPWRAEPGYGGTAPVGTYPSNGYGLFDMAGNVWEWTSDWYAATHAPSPHACCVPDGQARTTAAESLDPAQPQFRVPRKVIKGGSFACADSYCMRYRPAARRPQMVDTGMSHIGFRCVQRTVEIPRRG